MLSWVHEKQRLIRETQADPRVVSIDPGVRTPFTWYSPTKGMGKIGENDVGRLIRLCKHVDNLISEKDRLKSSTSKRKKKKASRVDRAIHRLQRKKFARFFTDEFDIIIVPPFEVSDMVNRKTRKINRSSVRKMLCWSHRMFRQRLLSKAEETGADVIIQNEAYTSQTCSGCGNLQRIGGSKIYRCRRCELVMDRDVNGARGIFLRALLDGAVSLE